MMIPCLLTAAVLLPQEPSDFRAQVRAAGEGGSGADPQRLAELDLLAQLAGGTAAAADPMSAIFGAGADASKTDSDLEPRLRAAKLLGPDALLPRDSGVASDLFQRMVAANLVTHGQLLAAHGEELAQRAHSEAGDLDALEVLAALYEATQDARLREVDAYGFQRYRDPRFGASMLAARGEDLKTDDPQLQAALGAFPSDPTIVRIALNCAHAEGKPLTDLLARQILAECAELVSWQSVAPWIRELERELAK